MNGEVIGVWLDGFGRLAEVLSVLLVFNNDGCGAGRNPCKVEYDSFSRGLAVLVDGNLDGGVAVQLIAGGSAV